MSDPGDRPNEIAAMAGTAVRGFAMGAADIVPGVSGGTIALILGIYERLLASVRDGARSLGSLARGDLAGFVRALRRIEWRFIGPLLVGILAAIVVLSSLIDSLLHDEPEAMAGLFFGLVVASIVIAWRMVSRRELAQLITLVGVAVIAFVVLGLQSGPASSPPAVAFLLSGSIAICAMILPGISGSFVLLMLGMYGAVIAAIDDRSIVELGAFAIGAVVGLALFSTALGFVLDRYRDTLLAALIGLMLGSLRVLWPWPNGVGVIGDADEQVDGTGVDWPETAGDAWVPILLAVVAAAAILGLDRLAPVIRARVVRA